jgi:hypothetical protein
MNAVFYTADPAEVIKMRIESLSLMAGTDEQLAPLFAADRMIGAAQFGSMPPPTPDARERYIRMEAVMIANHASEAGLTRLATWEPNLKGHMRRITIWITITWRVPAEW